MASLREFSTDGLVAVVSVLATAAGGVVPSNPTGDPLLTGVPTG